MLPFLPYLPVCASFTILLRLVTVEVSILIWNLVTWLGFLVPRYIFVLKNVPKSVTCVFLFVRLLPIP